MMTGTPQSIFGKVTKSCSVECHVSILHTEAVVSIYSMLKEIMELTRTGTVVLRSLERAETKRWNE